MSLIGDKTYVGFGLGAIQSGLFLYEALESGAFERLVVAEVLPDTVRRVRDNDGYLTVNIAHTDHIRASRIGPIEIYDPAVDADRQQLIEAVAAAHEIGTAVPGTRFYGSPGPESLCRILATGLKVKAEMGGPRAVIYAAENHNHAAEILEELVLTEIPPTEYGAVCNCVRFLNTVIGKMSGVITGNTDIKALYLTPITPDNDRAFLVEAFNRILISRIGFVEGNGEPVFQRGITTFIEKDDLLPFEEAKLFGHNATHALAAYIGALLGVKRIADLPSVPGIMKFLRQAFIEESGAALIHRYSGLDSLFTPEGYAVYADDLLTRMCNPWLADAVDRVGRDVERKLGWDDRLIGTLRLGLAEGVIPCRYALGAAAAMVFLDPSYLSGDADPAGRLPVLWDQSERDPAQKNDVLALIREGMRHLRQWVSASPRDSLALVAKYDPDLTR